MLQITNIQEHPIHYFPYKIVATRNANDGGIRSLVDATFPIWKGSVNSMPKELDAVIIASDLQGHCIVEDEAVLMGLVFPAELKLLLEIEFPELSPDKIGILLCGDLYAMTHRRGGIGDVREVWAAFQKHFRWVVGVAGNHDMIGPE